MGRALFIGVSGWSIPRQSLAAFPEHGSTLARYAARLRAAEINSSFYRSHRRTTWEGWARQTPPDFRFAVKAPRELTHRRRLADPAAPLEAFLEEISALGAKLGPVLFQLPPSLAFDPAAAEAFLIAWRDRFAGPTVWEPRHVSWFEPKPERLLAGYRIARAAADPACAPQAASPGGWPGLAYYRWHGSPRLYSSDYPVERLEALAADVSAISEAEEVWCVFDNTMHGAATRNALALTGLLAAERRRPRIAPGPPP